MFTFLYGMHLFLDSPFSQEHMSYVTDDQSTYGIGNATLASTQIL